MNPDELEQNRKNIEMFQSHKDGVTLAVTVQPKARKNEWAFNSGGGMRLRVTAPPEDGKANENVIRLLAEILDVKRSQVSIHTGASSRKKVILIQDISLEDIQARLPPRPAM